MILAILKSLLINLINQALEFGNQSLKLQNNSTNMKLLQVCTEEGGYPAHHHRRLISQDTRDRLHTLAWECSWRGNLIQPMLELQSNIVLPTIAQSFWTLYPFYQDLENSSQMSSYSTAGQTGSLSLRKA